MTITAGWGSVTDVQADQQPGPVVRELEHIALRLKVAEKVVEKRLLSERLGVHFYGYLEGSYTQNFKNPSNRINQLRSFDVNSNQFRPNLAQFRIQPDSEGQARNVRFQWDRRSGK
jgi:hypothetical protein